jgi:hypothetical protein
MFTYACENFRRATEATVWLQHEMLKAWLDFWPIALSIPTSDVPVVRDFLETQRRVGKDMVADSLSLLGGSKQDTDQRGDTAEESKHDFQKLEALALDRVQKGLAPPNEIYRQPCPNRIDWGKYPAWARPIDPEVFEGAGHEG